MTVRGENTPTPGLGWEVNYDSDVGSYGLLQGNVNIAFENPPEIPAVSLAGQTLWSDPGAWSSSVTFGNTFYAAVKINDIRRGVSSVNVEQVVTSAIDLGTLFTGQGPTERQLTFSRGVSSITGQAGAYLLSQNPTLNLTAQTALRYEVALASGTKMTLDQADVIVQSLTVQSGAELTIPTNNPLTIRALSTSDGAITLAGTFNNQASFFSNGTFTWTDGSFAGSGVFTNAGAFSISGTGRKVIAPDVSLSNSGMVIHAGTGTTVSLDSFMGWANDLHTSSFSNLAGAVYDFQSDGSIVGTRSGQPTGFKAATLSNSGTFRKSGGTGTSLVGSGVVFANSGIVEVTMGTLDFQGGGSTTDGTFSFANGGVARISGSSISLNGVNSLVGNGSLEIATGGFAYTPNAGSSTIAIGEGSTLLLSGGDLSAGTSGTLTLNTTGSGNIRWTGGNVQGGGWGANGVLVNTSPDFKISGTGSKIIAADTSLRNTGSIFQGGAGTTVVLDSFVGFGNDFHYSTVRNEAGAVYDFKGDGAIIGTRRGEPTGFKAGTVSNAGMFLKSGGTGTSVIGPGVVFENTGTVEVTSGTLEFRAAGSTTGGAFKFANGGVVRIAGGGIGLDGVNTLEGHGSFEVASGGFVYAPNAGNSTITIGEGSILLLSGGDLSAGTSGALTLKTSGSGGMKWTGGNIQGGGWGANGTLMNTSPNFTVSGTASKFVAGDTTLSNTGTMVQAGINTTISLDSFVGGGNDFHYSTIRNEVGAVYDFQGDGAIVGTRRGEPTGFKAGTVSNAGMFLKSDGTGTSLVGPGVVFDNAGTVEVRSGTLEFQGSVSQLANSTLASGKWNVGANSTLTISSGNKIFTNRARVILSGVGSIFTNIDGIASNEGGFSIVDGRSFTTSGNLSNSGDITIGDGSTLTVNGTFTGTSTGTLAGKGTLIGNATLAGVVAPGNSPGVLTNAGNLTFTPTTILNYELGNPSALAGDDRIDVIRTLLNLTGTGSLVLDGTLDVTDLGSFGLGVYPLLTYQGTLTDNGLVVNPLPGGYTGDILAGGGTVSLVVTGVPEPSVFGLLGAAALPMLRRRPRPR